MAIRVTASAIESALKQFSSLPDDAGVRLRTAGTLLACSNATIWRMAKAGKITARKVSKGVTVFTVGSIRNLLNGG